ncbi:MAG TPA: alpha/beta hydrolase [Candidatus Lokiarchaeia archaeon]|nr:alpha/beta hydrolase [Candidatus Lokiarchaeia archaeon]
MPKIQVNDIEVNYEVHGNGFPLILLAGFACELHFWDERMVRELGEKFQTILVDNRGAGLTDGSKGPYSIKQFANDTAGLMDALEIPTAYILGHSLGGMIAQQLAIDFAGRVAKLILCSTTCGGSKSIPMGPELAPRFQERVQGKLSLEGNLDLKVDSCFTEEFQQANPEFIAEFREINANIVMPRKTLVKQAIALMAFNSARFLKKLDIPTLILHGQKDRLIPPENAEIMAQYISGAKVVYLGESAHALYTPEPEAFMNALLEFLT